MSDTDNRSARRFEIEQEVQGRVRSRPVNLKVRDFSASGCKVAGGHGFAREGETVTLKIGNVRTPLGKVVWINGKEAGIAFETPMYDAIVEQLASELA